MKFARALEQRLKITHTKTKDNIAKTSHNSYFARETSSSVWSIHHSSAGGEREWLIQFKATKSVKVWY